LLLCCELALVKVPVKEQVYCVVSDQYYLYYLRSQIMAKHQQS
jgi:hypothetical protein